MAKLKELYNKILSFFMSMFVKTRDFFKNRVFNQAKSTIIFVSILLFSVLLVFQLYAIIFNDSIYNNASDDIIQYYKMMIGFIQTVREGRLSFFDLNSYFGASFFSNLYYVPLDLFTLLGIVLSFFMPAVVAVSSVELIKIVVGVALLGIYLALKNYKTKTIFWVSLIYFVNGGTVSFMLFPSFLTLTVYLPLSLILIHYFFKGKFIWIPVFVFVLVLHNFYLAYMVLAFISFAYILEYFKYQEFKIIDFLLKGLKFLSLLLLGVLMASVILIPAITFISEETLRDTVSYTPWILDLKWFDLKLFPKEVYIRYFAKMFAPTRPVSWSGFLYRYALEHISNYVTVIGFFLMTLIFFMKGKIAFVYKIMYGFLFVFALLPIFSSIFSGTFLMAYLADEVETAFPYTRWINMLPILHVLVIAYVIEHFDYKKLNRIYYVVSGTLLVSIGAYILYYYTKTLGDGETVVEKNSGFFVEVLEYDWKLMVVSIIILELALFLILFKKFKWIKTLIFVEVVIATGYMFVTAVSAHGYLSQHVETHHINEFINENIDDDEFFRVFVDTSKFNTDDRNFNQMTSYPTNTDIFHSWSDSETDDLAYLLFGKREKQTKTQMNYYSYYLSTFLGYKYLLTESSSDDYEGSNYYELVAKDDQFALYKIESVDGFYVYDQYITYQKLKYYADNYSQLTAERIFLMAAIIDQERYQDQFDFDDFFLDEVEDSELIFNPIEGNIQAWRIKNNSGIETIVEDSVSKDYYVYDNFNINYPSGEVALKDNNLSLSDYGQAFYYDHNDEKKLCKISPLPSDGSKTLIRCGQFFSPIDKIYIEKTPSMNQAPTYVMRLERAIDGASYLVYDFDLVSRDLSGFLLSFSFDDYDMGRIILEDDQGNRLSQVNGLYSADDGISKIYVYKSGELYQHNDLSSLYLDYSAIPVDSERNDLAIDKSIRIEGSNIHISYRYEQATTKDTIIVIPVTYSDDWQFTSGEKYDKISVSGGFLGIIVPEGQEAVDLELKFVPKNIDLGLQLSIGGWIIFAGLVAYPFVKKKLKQDG
jgi:hypothetical protein